MLRNYIHNSLDNIILFSLIILAIVNCLIIYLFSSPVDDGFIYLRVVRNIFAGQGWLYNQGEYVNPCTSPLQVIILLLLFPIVSSPSVFIIAYGIGILGVVFPLYNIFRSENRIMAALIVVAVVQDSDLIRSYGMETAIFLACIIWTAYFYQKKNSFLIGIFAGLTALARPEGATMIFIIMVADYIQYRIVSWRTFSAFCLIVFPWYLFSWIYFQTLLPHTIAAKSIQSHIGWWGVQPTWFMGFIDSKKLWIAPISTIGLWYMYRYMHGEWRFLIILLSFCVVQVLSYSILGAPTGYLWYYAPGSMAIKLSFAVGIYYLCNYIISNIKIFQHKYKDILSSKSFLIFIFLILLCLDIKINHKKYGPYGYWDEYTKAGKWIAENYQDNVKVASVEIGYIGYFSGKYIVDIHGLIHPDALKFIAAGDQWWWLERYRPELVITHKPSWYGELANDSDKRKYEAVWRHKDVIVYQRR